MFRRAVRWVLAGVLAGVTATTFATSASLGTPMHLETFPESPPTFELVIAPTDPVLGLINDAEFTIQLRNVSNEELAPGVVTLLVDLRPITDRSALLAGDLGAVPDQVVELGTFETPAVAIGDTFSITATFAASELPLTVATDPGVYLVGATFMETEASEAGPPLALEPPDAQADRLSVDATAPVVWRGFALEGTLPLVTVVPLVFPEAADRPLTTDDLASRLGEDSRLEALFSAAEAFGATVAVDPKAIASVRAFGGTAPEAAREFTERILAGDVETFALQYADADPGLQAHLDVEELLQPSGLSFMTRFWTPPPVLALDTEEDSESPEPSDSPEDAADTEVGSDLDGDPADPHNPGPPVIPNVPEVPVVPETDELLDWTPTLEGIAWPSSESVSRESLGFMRDQGLSIVLWEGPESAATTSPAGTAAGTTLLMSDQAVEESLTAFLLAETNASRAHAAAVVSALTAIDSAADTGPTIVALNRAVIATAPEPTRVFDLLTELPWIDTAPLASIVPEAITDEQRAAEAPEAANKPTVPRPSVESLVPSTAFTETDEGASSDTDSTFEARVAALDAALERETDIVDYSRVLVEPDLLIDYQRDRILTHTSSGTREARDIFAELDEAYRERDRDLLDGIRIVDTEHTRLLGTSSRIPIQLRNTLPFDAAVRGDITATSAALTVDEPEIESMQIAAGSSTNHLVPVSARVSNGVTGLLVSIDDTHEGDSITSRRLEIIIQSDIEIIALASLATLAVGFFGVGTFRSIRQHRADRNRTDHEADASIP